MEQRINFVFLQVQKTRTEREKKHNKRQYNQLKYK